MTRRIIYKQVILRLTRDEYWSVKKNAMAANLPVSKYIFFLLFNAKLDPIIVKDLNAGLIKISLVGNESTNSGPPATENPHRVGESAEKVKG